MCDARAMPYERLRWGRWSEPGRIYLVTTRTAGRRPHFRDFAAAACVARALVGLERAGCWRLMAWVVMPDHVHVLAGLQDGSLPAAMRHFKGRTGRIVGTMHRGVGPLWQKGYHDHAVRREEDLRTLARYVCANPVRAGIARSLREYPFWDACWLREERPAEAGPTRSG